MDGLEGHEPEKGLRKESKPNWASPNWRNWWPHTSSSSSSSSTTHQTEENDRSYGSNSEDSNFLRPPTDWDRRGGTGGGSKAQTEYGENDSRVCVHLFVSVCVRVCICVCGCEEMSAQCRMFSRVHRLSFEHWSPAFSTDGHSLMWNL